MSTAWRWVCLLLGAYLSACAAKPTTTSSGVEGVQTAQQRAQAERFVINPNLGTRVPGQIDANTAAMEPQTTRAIAKPPSCSQGPFALRSLPIAELRLSNQGVDAALQMLGVMGYTIIAPDKHASVRPASFDCKQLPVIVRPSLPTDEELTFSESHRVNIGAREGQSFSPLRTGSSEDLDRVLVFYHPDDMDKLSLLESRIKQHIDKPSPQVFLETLVVEVNKEDSKELGVDWQNANLARQSVLSLGQLAPGLGSSVDFLRDTLSQNGQLSFNPGQGVQFRLKALVESGRAQVLSRPSILALSNRQAIIQIVDIVQTPNLSSRADINGNFTVSDYSFEPLLIGITLSLRPRVSADRQWVSMEIDATVDAEVDENSGDVFASDGKGDRVLLASKPGLSSRKVKTFARIPDRTPIVIGGLAAANQEKIKSRVPILGAIPWLGSLFGATDNEVQEREIVIVLTPYVLDESHQSIRTNGYLGASEQPASAPTNFRYIDTPSANSLILPPEVSLPAASTSRPYAQSQSPPGAAPSNYESSPVMPF